MIFRVFLGVVLFCRLGSPSGKHVFSCFSVFSLFFETLQGLCIGIFSDAMFFEVVFSL